ncbi:MAG: lamin tail domain-containing protein [Patescibacteria group bacterium]
MIFSLGKTVLGFVALMGAVFLFSPPTPVLSAAAGHVVISQVQITGGSGQTTRDFIELYNPTETTLDLSGWKLRKKTKTGTESSVRVFESGKIIPAHGYFLWANSENGYYMSVSADASSTATLAEDNSIALLNASSTLVDALAWGIGHVNPFVEGTAFSSNPGANQALVRRPNDGNGNGEDTDNNTNDFLLATSSPRNSQSAPPPPPPPDSPPPEPPPQPPANPSGNENVQIFINEFLSDPGQNEKEWVELYNAGNRALDLTGWRIEEGSEEETKLSGLISARDYFLVESPKGNLNNAGDIIQLFDYDGSLQDKVAYGSWDDGNKFDNAPVAYDGKSVGRLIGTNTGNNKTDFAPTLRPTPRADNLFGVISANLNQSTQSYSSLSSASIILNEILPNPKGSDQDKEFVELKNVSADNVSLGGWKLTNRGGSSYALPATSTIPAGSFLVVSRQSSRLALKNTGGEALELYDAANHLVDKAVYEDEAADDLSYNRLSSTSTVWQWSKALTPGRENIINTPNLAPQIFVVLPNALLAGEEAVFDASDTFDSDDEDLNFQWELEGGIKAEGDSFIYVFEKAGSYGLILKVTDSHGNKVEKKMTVKVTDDNAPEVLKSAESVKSESGVTKGSSGGRVCVRGNVSVLPGVFSSQTFYIFDSAEQSGWPVYMFKKDFPPLTVGDLVEACGEFGSYQGYERLKTKTRFDFRPLAQNQKIEPLVFGVGDITEENLFALVKISAEVLETGSGYFYLGDDEGEIKAQLKKNIDWKKGLLKAGEKAEVTGIIGKSKNELVLWPLSAESIKVTAGKEASEASAILGSKKKYWAAGGGGAVSLFLAFLGRGKSALLKSVAAGFISKAAFWKKRDDNFPPLTPPPV